MGKRMRKILLITALLGAGLNLGAMGSEPVSVEASQTGAIADTEYSWEIDTSPVTLSIYVDIDRDFGQFWGQNAVSKQLIADTGVDLDWLICSKPIEQLRLLIASGDLPDIIQAQGVEESPEIIELAKRGYVWDLMELSDQYAPSFMRRVYAIAPHALLGHRIAFETDRMYVNRSFFVPYDKMDDPHVMKNKEGITVIQQLWEQIGSPKPTTTAEYIDMLKKVKQKWPDMIPAQSHRNPQNDESPQIVHVSLPIAGLSQKYFKMGDTVIRYWEHPNFVKLLEFANTMYNEKLLNQAEFTQGKGQLKSNVRNGNVFSEIMQDSDNVEPWSVKFLQKVNPDWNFWMIDPVVIDPSTMKYTRDSIFGGAGRNPMMIPKSTKYPDRAIRLFDYLNAEKFQNFWFSASRTNTTLVGPTVFPPIRIWVNS